MSILRSLREHVRDHPARTLSSAFAILLVMQIMMSESSYNKFSVAAIFFVFAFKSWVNFVFSMTTHRQRGETLLSQAIERYFWSLLGQSSAFSVLFLVAFLDLMGVQVWGMDWMPMRNFIRTVAIVSVMSVIIYGDQTLEALKDYIQREKERTEGVSA